MPVAPLGKGQYTPCRFERSPIAARGPGCSIYPTRPLACRSWSCQWLTTPSWAEAARPDRSGFVVDPVVDIVQINGKERRAAQVWALPGHEDAFTSDVARPIIEELIARGLVVLWRMPGQVARALLKYKDTIGVTSTAPSTAHLGSEVERFLRAEALKQE